MNQPREKITARPAEDDSGPSKPLLTSYSDEDTDEHAPHGNSTRAPRRTKDQLSPTLKRIGATRPTLWTPPRRRISPSHSTTTVTSSSSSIMFRHDNRSGQRLPEDLHRQMQNGSNWTRRRRHRIALIWSYAPDWILCVGLVGCFYLLDYIHGYWREFSLTDTSIQHSFAVRERVPDFLLTILAGVAPAILLPTVNFLSIRSWWDLHMGWLGLLLSLSLTGVITQVVKVTVGRPRPDLIARCMPKPGSQNADVFGLVTAEICTQTNNLILKDGFRSFPSGHSSLSFAGLGFLSFYLAGKVHLFDERGHTSKAWLSLTPLLGAALVAISRTMDYRHHWHDVTTGSTLGLLLAFFSYRQYYPPLSSAISHRPYKPRISFDDNRGAYGDLEQGADAATASDEEAHSHIQHHSRHDNPLAGGSIRSGTGSRLNSFRRPQRGEGEASAVLEMGEQTSRAGNVPDEERGPTKPHPPQRVHDMWRDERERDPPEGV